MASRIPTVIVTGASRGIGLAISQILLNKFHANVVAITRATTPALEALKSESFLTIQCDITNEQAFYSAVNTAVNTYGGIDGLILNAGTLDPLCRIGDDTPLEAWQTAFNVNFFSLVTAVKATLPYLRKSALRGRIVFVSSGAAARGVPGWGPYSATKAAMNSLCRTLAEEEQNVVSVAVRPGVVDTDMQASIRQYGGPHMSGTDHERFLRDYAAGKLVKPEDCGHVLAALALGAPAELSGKFVSWDGDECQPFRKE